MTIESQLNDLIDQTNALDDTVSGELVDVNSDLSAVRTRVANLEILLGATANSGGGLVNRIVAGAGISISPSNGRGAVTITSTGSGGSESNTSGNQSGGGEASSIVVVASLPTTGNFLGRVVLFENVLYTWDGTQWIAVNASLTPDAPDAISVVATLPAAAADGTVVFLTTDNYLYERVNGAWVQVAVTVNTSATIADASITVAKFAQGLRPVEIVDALPTTGNAAGRLVFLTTDSKLYRHNGTAFVNTVNTTDLTGTIGADQIAANAITTGKISAGAINTAQIAAGAVNAGQLAAGSVTADKIVSNAVTAEKIASSAITSDKIAANTITAGKIAAGAIGADQVAAGAITADKIGAGTIITGSAQIGNAVVSTLNIAGNAITSSSAFSATGDVNNIGTTPVVVVSGTISTSGTQPIMVMLSAFCGGATSTGNPNNTDIDVSATVSIGSNTQTIVPNLTVQGSKLSAASASALFTNIAAGTYTISVSFRATAVGTGFAGFLVRNPKIIVLETKR